MEAEAYRIAEEASKGVDEAYVRQLCQEAAERFGVTPSAMYEAARSQSLRHFA